MSKAEKLGHGRYVWPIKGHVEIPGERKPYLELWILLDPKDSKKLAFQIKKLEKSKNGRA